MSDTVENCSICGKPLTEGGSWIDDEVYGDVHEACLEQIENGGE